MKKVLVLEDESSIRSFIVINLRRAGYDVIEAETGEEALERLREHPDVTVALLDIMLPGIDGFEVCRRIRATNTRIGIIMLTARSQEMDKVTGLMTGADDYVTKPLFSSGTDRPGRRPVSQGRRGRPRCDRRDPPAALPAEHPEPDPGEKRPAGEADPSGVLHYECVHGAPGQGSFPGGNFGQGVGEGLLRRAEDRGCEHPPPAFENRGQCTESHLYYNGVGLWL